MGRSLMLGLAAAVAGCGLGCGDPDREKTLSVLNVEADRWDGGQAFVTNAADGYGRPVAAKVEKGVIYNTLELRSSGPDGLPKNTDDVVVTRSKKHGETTFAKEAAKAAEEVSAGAAKGAIQGAAGASQDAGKAAEAVGAGAAKGAAKGIKDALGIGGKKP